MKQSSRHHYVPQWYQRRFMADGQTTYFRLDKKPNKTVIPSGTIFRNRTIDKKGPKKYFYEIDLYTTNYFGDESDAIERYLFGRIDSNGAKAIAALASVDWMQKIHPHLMSFFEYMDAQRLRTPKGLAWLTTILKPQDHNQLLFQMQRIRRMHCTMWAEASIEIVGANNSDVKFIVSDNPVTTYNSAFYPGDRACAFPNDPGVELQGTRTIFPLDSNHCAILTNLEYARKPGPSKAAKPRTNSRYFDQTIINYDDIIREREFTQNQVLAINHVLKTRAHRFIAAADESWLYPERYLKSKDWGRIDKVFAYKGKSLRLHGKGGELFIGGKDGSLIATQDEFGRRPETEKDWYEKQRLADDMDAQFRTLLNRNKG